MERVFVNYGAPSPDYAEAASSYAQASEDRVVRQADARLRRDGSGPTGVPVRTPMRSFDSGVLHSETEKLVLTINLRPYEFNVKIISPA
jgi:hypothetical protein